MHVNKWLDAELFSAIEENIVHVWRLSLQPSDEIFSLAESTLTMAEEERANRFYFEKGRKQFIAARGQLKLLLGKYLETNPANLQFSLNQYGKPYLDNQLAGTYFNISHSHNLALAGFSIGLDIGVDIEYRRPDWSGLHIARRFFAEQEVRDLLNLEDSKQHQAFFDCWSRKEAYIKARGTGLATPLRMFTVSLDPDKPAELCTTNHEPQAVNQWSLKNINVHPDYSAAIVANTKTWQLKLFDGLNDYYHRKIL